MAAIVQRGEKWQAKVRRDGYPSVSKTFARKSDAEAWARAQESEMDRGAWRDRSSADSTTLYKLLERYLVDVVPGKRGAAVETLRIKTLMSDKLTLHKLSALSPLVLSEWIESRAKVVSGSTINRELNVISAAVNWGRKRLMIQTENPVAGIIRPPQGKARERRLEDGEEARLLEALEVMLTAVNERWNLASTSKQQSGVTVLVFPFGTIYCGFNWRPAGLPAGGLRSKVPSGKRSAAGLGSAVWMGR